MDAFKDQVKKGFENCRNDIESIKNTSENLKQENSHLKDRLFLLEQENSKITEQNTKLANNISELSSELKGLKIALDYIKSFTESQQQSIMQVQQAQQTQTTNPQATTAIPAQVQQTQIQTQNAQNQTQAQNIPITEQDQTQNIPNYHEQHIPTRNIYNNIALPPRTEKKTHSDPYEALLAFKARANKREILKQKMLSMVSENGINLSELKFMIVEHFRYCSKASFYNYLKELELENHIKIEREKTKNIVYLTHLQKEI